ncbi:MAG: hypothetical protein ACPLXP_03345 [Microgenomates group bacterium]
MKMQQFDPKIISITQLRRDIDALEEILVKNEEAWIMRNQDLLFVALAPERYRRLQSGEVEENKIDAAVAAIKDIRNKFGRAKKTSISDYVSLMREERIKKWRR